MTEKQATITKWIDLLQDLEFSGGSAFCTLQLEICTFAEIEEEGQPQAVAQTSRGGMEPVAERRMENGERWKSWGGRDGRSAGSNHCNRGLYTSLSHLRTMLLESSSRPLPAKRPNHAT